LKAQTIYKTKKKSSSRGLQVVQNIWEPFSPELGRLY